MSPQALARFFGTLAARLPSTFWLAEDNEDVHSVYGTIYDPEGTEIGWLFVGEALAKSFRKAIEGPGGEIVAGNWLRRHDEL